MVDSLVRLPGQYKLNTIFIACLNNQGVFGFTASMQKYLLSTNDEMRIAILGNTLNDK